MDTISIIMEDQLAIDLLSVNTIYTNMFPGGLLKKGSVISRWTTIRNNDWGGNLCFSTRKNDSCYFLVWTHFQLGDDNKIFLGFWRLRTHEYPIAGVHPSTAPCSIYFPSKQWCKWIKWMHFNGILPLSLPPQVFFFPVLSKSEQ